MGRFFALGAGILALAMLGPVAWSQETPPPEDPLLAQAISTVNSPASVLELKKVRKYLVDHRADARTQIVQLLGSADAPVRINAAIVLSDMAKAGDTTGALMDALLKAVQDKDFTVAYWGFIGLLSDGVPMHSLQDARQFLVEQRQTERPLVMQMLGDTNVLVRMNAAIVLSSIAKAGDTSAATLHALQTAAKDKELAVVYWGVQGLLTEGVPVADQRAVLLDMMKMERPRALRLAVLTIIEERKLNLAAPILVSHLQEIMASKEYATQVETLVTSQETTEHTAPAPVGRPGASAPTYAPPGAPPMPGVAPAGAAAAAPVATQVRLADIPKLKLEELQVLAQKVEALPIVAEVHQMGLVLEEIVGATEPNAPTFEFKTTPPWRLNECVDRAVIYMNSHREAYGAPPSETPQPPATPAATAPAPATAVPPAARPAPATTATAPAGATRTP